MPESQFLPIYCTLFASPYFIFCNLYWGIEILNRVLSSMQERSSILIKILNFEKNLIANVVIGIKIWFSLEFRFKLNTWASVQQWRFICDIIRCVDRFCINSFVFDFWPPFSTCLKKAEACLATAIRTRPPCVMFCGGDVFILGREIMFFCHYHETDGGGLEF